VSGSSVTQGKKRDRVHIPRILHDSLVQDDLTFRTVVRTFEPDINSNPTCTTTQITYTLSQRQKCTFQFLQFCRYLFTSHLFSQIQRKSFLLLQIIRREIPSKTSHLSQHLIPSNHLCELPSLLRLERVN